MPMFLYGLAFYLVVLRIFQETVIENLPYFQNTCLPLVELLSEMNAKNALQLIFHQLESIIYTY